MARAGTSESLKEPAGGKAKTAATVKAVPAVKAAKPLKAATAKAAAKAKDKEKAPAKAATKAARTPAKAAKAPAKAATKTAKAATRTAKAPAKAAKCAAKAAKGPTKAPARPARKTPAKAAPAKAAPVKPAKPAKAAPAKSPAKVAPAKPAAPAFPPKTMEKLRRLLEEERGTYLRQALDLAAEAEALASEREQGDTQFDEESGEGDTLNIERERDLVLSASARAAVDEVDRALARMDAGIYGICERCGKKISVARLEALPYAALCIDCKSREERRR